MKRLLLTSAAALFATTAFAADPELIVFDWSGYEEEGFYPDYTAKHGDIPTFAFFGEEEEAFQKLRSGFRADVGHPCSQSVEKWRDAGLIEPWDISQVPAYGNVGAAYKENPIFADESGVYFIPADLGATAIAYNTEEVPAADIESLQVFLDPKYAGRTSLPDNVDDAYSLAFLATGVTDWTTATPAQVDAASEWMRKAHANVRAYWADGAELAQLMATGEVLISWAWNETPVTMTADGAPIGYQREAKEGSSLWFCGYVNLQNGPGSEQKAHDFMNAWLQPEVTDYMVNEWGYGHGNAQAMADFDTEILDEVGMGKIDAPILRQLPLENAIREQMVTSFEKIKAGF